MAGRRSRRNKNLLAKGTTCALVAGVTALLVAGCARAASAATAAGPDVDLAPTELFHDIAREQPAVHAALRDLVLTKEQLDLELQPHASRAR
jgi:hypothetical protein